MCQVPYRRLHRNLLSIESFSFRRLLNPELRFVRSYLRAAVLKELESYTMFTLRFSTLCESTRDFLPIEKKSANQYTPNRVGVNSKSQMWKKSKKISQNLKLYIGRVESVRFRANSAPNHIIIWIALETELFRFLLLYSQKHSRSKLSRKRETRSSVSELRLRPR